MTPPPPPPTPPAPRYPSLPWPEDVPRRPLPRPFYAEYLAAICVGATLAYLRLKREGPE